MATFSSIAQKRHQRNVIQLRELNFTRPGLFLPTEDIYNELEYAIAGVLEADSKLGVGGSMELKRIDLEHQEDVASIPGHLLPAVSIEVNVSGRNLLTIGNQMAHGWLASIVLVTSGAIPATVKKNLKQIAARIEKVMNFENWGPSNSLIQNIEGAEDFSAQVEIQGTQLDTVRTNSNTVRGVAEILVGITFDYTIPQS